MPDLKDLFSPVLITALAKQMKLAWPGFPVRQLTSRFSSEGPIRPFIERHTQVTFSYLHRWVHDADEHVRRLVSEGTRPRLEVNGRVLGGADLEVIE